MRQNIKSLGVPAPSTSYQTGVINIDTRGYVLSTSEDATQILTACHDVLEVDKDNQLWINDEPISEILLQASWRHGGTAPKQMVANSTAANAEVTLDILRRRGFGASVIAFACGGLRHPLGCTLSPREMDVLLLATKGLRRDRMAHVLGISVATVDLHCGNLRKKMRAKTTPEAVAKALTRIRLEEHCLGSIM